MSIEYAFPSSDLGIHGTYGMTLRDYFAAQALPEVVRRYPISTATTVDEAAELAYEMADAMLRAREVQS
ncbi:hypothetical protein [Rhodanobacter hydrolyticus]|uniref:Uncharacterized protein n=1 Tax=Rhodanobacter hydrolyticus TaxID=2250595 RepID=A0ABW8J4D1_9GAMM